MHARTVRSEGSPDVLEKFTELIQSQVVPTLNTYPGFAGAYWIVDREAGKGIAYFFYESADHLKETADRAGALRESIAEQTGSRVTEVKEHEVIADTGQKVHHDATHARVTTLRVDPARRQDGIDTVKSVVIPNAQKLPGFLGGFWLNDGAHQSSGVTLWDSQASLEGSRIPVDRLRQDAAARSGAEVLSVEEFEILARADTPVHAH